MSDFNLRIMTKDDLDKVLLWRNHPDIRRFMYSTHEITREEHHNWFSRTKTNPSIYLLIFEHEHVGLGFANVTIGKYPSVADWGFYLAPNAPRGTGGMMGRQVLDFAFSELRLSKVCGQVLDFNDRSVRYHQTLGFKVEGRLRKQHCIDGVYHDVICFGLLETEWTTDKKA